MKYGLLILLKISTNKIFLDFMEFMEENILKRIFKMLNFPDLKIKVNSFSFINLIYFNYFYRIIQVLSLYFISQKMIKGSIKPKKFFRILNAEKILKSFLITLKGIYSMLL